MDLEIRAMRQSETLFCFFFPISNLCFSDFETEQKAGIFTHGSGNHDTSKFALKDRDISIKSV